MRSRLLGPGTNAALPADPGLTRRGFLRAAGLIGLGAALGPAILGALSGCSPETTLQAKMGIVFGNQILWRYVAQRKAALLKPKGYEVDFLIYPDESQLIDDFATGKIDACATLLNSLPALAAVAETQLFLPIAWMKSGFPIIVPETSKIESIKDLKGKRLAAFDPGHPSIAYWRAFTQENYGFELTEEVQLVSYGQLVVGSPTTALTDNRADAAMVESDALSTLQPKGSYRQIADLRTEWRTISKSDRLLVYGGYAARSEWIQANKKFVDDLIHINFAALKEYKKNPDLVTGVSAAYTGQNVPIMAKESSKLVAEYLGYDEVEAERIYLSPADVDDQKKVFYLLTKTGHLKSLPLDADRLFYLSDQRPKQG